MPGMGGGGVVLGPPTPIPRYIGFGRERCRFPPKCAAVVPVGALPPPFHTPPPFTNSLRLTYPLSNPSPISSFMTPSPTPHHPFLTNPHPPLSHRHLSPHLCPLTHPSPTRTYPLSNPSPYLLIYASSPTPQPPSSTTPSPCPLEGGGGGDRFKGVHGVGSCEREREGLSLSSPFQNLLDSEKFDGGFYRV